MSLFASIDKELATLEPTQNGFLDQLQQQGGQGGLPFQTRSRRLPVRRRLGDPVHSANRNFGTLHEHYMPLANRNPPVGNMNYSHCSIPHQNQMEAQCSICLCEFQKREQTHVLPCHHQFHPNCISKWAKQKRTCPISKTVF